MARPIKSGGEKAVIISVSVSPADKKFLDDNNLSPSKLFHDLLVKYCNAPQDEKVCVESDVKKKLREDIMDTLINLKNLYTWKLTPEGDYSKKEKQFEMAVNFVVKKYSPHITKAEIMSFVERKSGYLNLDNLKEPKEVEGNETL